jgi:pimeloyl-ACP methyl ester carboxylesterase
VASQHAGAIPSRRFGLRPILFIGEDDIICPPQNAKRMYDAALSPDKTLLIVPHADHDTTYSSSPHVYESTVISFLSKS